MAKQLSHSLEELFKAYAKWINRSNNDTQQTLIEQAIDKQKIKQEKVGIKIN